MGGKECGERLGTLTCYLILLSSHWCWKGKISIGCRYQVLGSVNNLALKLFIFQNGPCCFLLLLNDSPKEPQLIFNETVLFEILSYILVWRVFYFALHLFVGYGGVYWDGKYTGDVTSHVQYFVIFNGLSQNLHLLFLPHLFLPLPLLLFLLSSIATCYMSNKNKSWVFFFLYLFLETQSLSLLSLRPYFRGLFLQSDFYRWYSVQQSFFNHCGRIQDTGSQRWNC